MRTISLILINMILLLFPLSGRAATDPGWSCDIHAYQYDMSVYLVLRQANKPVTGDFVVAAFVGDECRGIAEAQSVKEASYYYLRVRSNEMEEDSVCFKVYDRAGGKELVTSGSVPFENLSQIGYPSQPWVLTLPVMIDPSDPGALNGVNEETEDLHLTGVWTEENLAKLREKLHPDDKDNENLSSVDMSEVTLGKGVSLGNLFANNNVLTSVILPNLPETGLSETTFDNTNPNCIVFVKEGTVVPEQWSNDVNIVIGSKASQLVLKEQYPFYTPTEITVDQVSYERTFSEESVLKSALLGGWETICLPFDAMVIKVGDTMLEPVSISEGKESGDFYVATLTDRGFEYIVNRDENDPLLKANTPYLINMVSPAGNKIKGKVVFLADPEIGKVSIKATEPFYRQEQSQYDLIGVFRKVVQSDGVYAISEAGDAFEKGGDVYPFEAYLYSLTASSPISITMYTAVTGVQLSQKTASIESGKAVTLSATILPEGATNRNLQWSSSNESVASVSSLGVVTGVKEGTATIQVKTEDGGFTATCSITVTKGTTLPTPPVQTVKVTGVTVNPGSYTLNVDETVQLSVVVKPADATNKKVLWSSSDTSVASVDETGLVSGHKAGNTVVSVKTEDGNFKADSYISVNLITGVEEVDSGDIRIYPAITSSSFVISGLQGEGRLELISYLGHTVKTLKITSSTVDISAIRAGSYIVRITQNKKVYIFKIVKK